MLADLTLQLVLAALVIWGLVALASTSPKSPAMSSAESKTVESIAIAIVIFFVFTIFFGYFIAFEAAWNGQTPGKRLLGIRVVRDGGYPVDFMGSLVRNLVRTLEFALGFYALSAVVTLLSSENKRLGDYAAGTIVVRDSGIAAPTFAQIEAAPGLGARVNADERLLISRFLARRADLLPQRRTELAAQIAAALRTKFTGTEYAQLDDEALIERVDAGL